MKENFDAWLLDADSVRHDTVFTWRVLHSRIGTLNAEGPFEAQVKGHTFVTASVGPWLGKASVVVHQDSLTWALHEAGVHVIVIPRDTLCAFRAASCSSLQLLSTASEIPFGYFYVHRSWRQTGN
jgi:hypothetical protein